MGSLLNMFDTCLHVNYKYWWILFRSGCHSEIDLEWSFLPQEKDLDFRLKGSLSGCGRQFPGMMEKNNGNDSPLRLCDILQLTKRLSIQNLIWFTQFPCKIGIRAGSCLHPRDKVMGTKEQWWEEKLQGQASPENDSSSSWRFWDCASSVWGKCPPPPCWVQPLYLFPISFLDTSIQT